MSMTIQSIVHQQLASDLYFIENIKRSLQNSQFFYFVNKFEKRILKISIGLSSTKIDLMVQNVPNTNDQSRMTLYLFNISILREKTFIRSTLLHFNYVSIEIGSVLRRLKLY